MAISQHTRFENHMDISSPETIGDAQKISDFFNENPYDDYFEEKLSQVNKNISPNEHSIKNINESVDKTDESAHIKKENGNTKDESKNLALNPTKPPLPKVVEEGNEKKDDVLIDAGNAIESIGNDSDNQAEFVDESSRNDMTDDAKKRISDSIVEGGNPPISPDSNIEFKRDIAYCSVADANPEYGDGGGIQYFIPHAYDIKKAGMLSRIDSPEKFNFNIKDIVKADIRDSTNAEYKIHLDKREFSGDDATEILDSSSDITSGELSESISKVDLQYLDENTIATEGLTDNKDRFFINENGVLDSHEDYYRPHGNQEDTYKNKEPEKWIMPDSWSNPIELKEGEVFYQLTPVFRDGQSDTFSSYFTDKDTVDKCKDKNGIVSISALMQKLQMPPKTEILEEAGERKEVYVNNYELTAYVYKKEPI